MGTESYEYGETIFNSGKVTSVIRIDFWAQMKGVNPRVTVIHSLADIQRKYGVGRTVSMSDIQSGKLRATERRCRGGKIGKFVTVEECERVYARVAGRV